MRPIDWYLAFGVLSCFPAAACLSACGTKGAGAGTELDAGNEASSTDATGPVVDATGPSTDASPSDAGPSTDASPFDAGPSTDASPSTDAGPSTDASPSLDASPPFDATSLDAAGPEAGLADGSDGDSGCEGCVLVARDGGSPFWIDSTEVSNGAYAAWLATQPSTATQPPACSWNTSFVPTENWPGPADLPVASVDWCDAYAYCAAAGKTLCGAVGGQAEAYTQDDNPSVDEWYIACSGAGALPYPYGATYDPMKCNGADYGANGRTAVGSLPGCVGSVPHLFDMSGNVWEWENACEGDSGAGDLCRRRGGSWFSDGGLLECAVGASDARNAALSYIGFRCCKD